ncbi:MAG: zinc-binding dehydrogenase [Zoogloea sp.]|nr:zinc-binding dehydrogenase [Zoogloea sp.]
MNVLSARPTGLSHPASLTQTEQHLAEIIQVIAPQGRLALIDDPRQLDVMGFKQKSVSIHWEFMFTRSSFATPDMQAQHEILEEAARLVDAGELKSTLSSHFGPISAANLKRAHALLESGRSRGKIVLEGFAA